MRKNQIRKSLNLSEACFRQIFYVIGNSYGIPYYIKNIILKPYLYFLIINLHFCATKNVYLHFLVKN